MESADEEKKGKVYSLMMMGKGVLGTSFNSENEGITAHDFLQAYRAKLRLEPSHLAKWGDGSRTGCRILRAYVPRGGKIASVAIFVPDGVERASAHAELAERFGVQVVDLDSMLA